MRQKKARRRRKSIASVSLWTGGRERESNRGRTVLDLLELHRLEHLGVLGVAEGVEGRARVAVDAAPAEPRLEAREAAGLALRPRERLDGVYALSDDIRFI